MLGAAGALCCFAACTGAGLLLRDRCRERLAGLMGWADALGAMKLLFSEERLPMDELLGEASRGVASGGMEGKVRLRLEKTAGALRAEPSLTVEEAYEMACAQVPMTAEGQEEKAALQLLFRQLGSGTAAMREKAVDGCLKRMEIGCEKARVKAEQSGALYAKLGALGGLMLAIALW